MWEAGRLALDHASDNSHQNSLIALELEKIFDKLDSEQEEVRLIKQVLPYGASPKFPLGELLKEMDEERRELYVIQHPQSSRPLNPFESSRLQIIETLSLYIEMAFRESTQR
jgi:hypothetical protein